MMKMKMMHETIRLDYKSLKRLSFGGLPILAGYISDAVLHNDPRPGFNFAGEFDDLSNIFRGDPSCGSFLEIMVKAGDTVCSRRRAKANQDLGLLVHNAIPF
jgi:hypothetical protein